MQLRDLLKPHQLEMLEQLTGKKIQTRLTPPTQGKASTEKTVNKNVPKVIVKRKRDIDPNLKGNS